MPSAIELDSPKQFVNETLDRAGWQPLGVIQIIDHGTVTAKGGAVGFEVGDSEINSDTWPNYSADFARLAGKFAPRGYLELKNCYAGLIQGGLLQELADTIKAPVLAWTGATDGYGYTSGTPIWTEPNKR